MQTRILPKGKHIPCQMLKRKFESQMPSESKDTKQSVCKRSTVTFTELLFGFAESS